MSEQPGDPHPPAEAGDGDSAKRHGDELAEVVESEPDGEPDDEQ